MNLESSKKKFADTARMLFNRGIVSGADGTAIWRVGKNHVLITPPLSGFGTLTAEDVRSEPLDGRFKADLTSGVSGEFLKEILRRNPDIKAVVHGHPRFASILGLLKESPSMFILPDLERRIGPVKMLEFKTRWAEETLELLKTFPRPSGTVLVENLGLFVFADDLPKAARLLDSLEQYFEIIYHTRLQYWTERPMIGEDIQPVERHLSKVYLEVTTRCNFSCKTCLRKTGVVPKDRDMPLARVKKLAAELTAMGTCEDVVLLGYGEILCHPQAFDILDILKSKGFRVTLVTNGHLLTHPAAEKLVDAGVDKVFVSIDGGDYLVHQKIRSGSDFTRIVRNLKHLDRLKKERHAEQPVLGLETVVTRENMRQVRHILRLADDVRAGEVLMSNLLPYSSEMAESSLVGTPGGPILRNKISSSRVKVGRMDYRGPIRCKFIAEGAAFISVEGDVSACLVTSRAHSAYILGVQKPIARLTFGNAFKTGIRDVWNSEAYRAYREKFRRFDFPDCFSCSLPELCLNRTTGEHDCFHSESPCSDCFWAKEIILCP